MSKVGVIGVPGKMALRVVALAEALSSALARPGSAAIGKDAGALAGVSERGVRVAAFDAGLFANADVWIEFAHPSVTKSSVAAARQAKRALLVCTTGLARDDVALLEAAASDIPVMLAPNTSLGVAALNAALRVALKALGPSYAAEIVELHHGRKKDAPSGTALRLADTIEKVRGLTADSLVTGRNGQVGERKSEEIGVFAVRGGNVIGEHTVYLFGDNDRLELTHRAQNRDLFAAGALRAAQWLVAQRPGWYTIENCLGLNAEGA